MNFQFVPRIASFSLTVLGVIDLFGASKQEWRGREWCALKGLSLR